MATVGGGETGWRGVGLAVLTAWMAWGTAAAAEPLRIGIAGPMTGAYAPFGEQFWRGASMAAQDINASGGVNGRLIELIKADDACEPKQAVAVASRLVDSDKVDLVVGHFCSSTTIAASSAYADAGMMQITPGSTNPKVTESQIPTIFRTCGRDDQQGSVAAEFIVKKLQAKAVAVIHDKDTYGQGLADAMRHRMGQLGVKEVIYEGITRGEKDFNALVTKLKSLKVDAVYFGGLHNEAGPFVRQMREQGLTAAFISGDGIVSNQFVLDAGGPQFAKGVYMTFGADPRKISAGKSVVDRFRKEGYEPEGYTLYSYVALQAIAAAVKGAGGPDGAKASAWLKANTVQTVMGSKSWDAKGDLKDTDYVMYRWGSDGQYAQME
ncbi:MAG: branched-chain amino acid ABC transporter substrate-binding protein [Magnetococcales bacterium]|nr:branched-chain amino acid ABC transporter substrate-binding protein [Magnetococcales bacterium]